MVNNTTTEQIRSVPDYTIEAVEKMRKDAVERFTDARHPDVFTYGSVDYIVALTEYREAVTELVTLTRVLSVLRG